MMINKFPFTYECDFIKEDFLLWIEFGKELDSLRLLSYSGYLNSYKKTRK